MSAGVAVGKGVLVDAGEGEGVTVELGAGVTVPQSSELEAGIQTCTAFETYELFELGLL